MEPCLNILLRAQNFSTRQD